jgi:hypothetical protein
MRYSEGARDTGSLILIFGEGRRIFIVYQQSVNWVLEKIEGDVGRILTGADRYLCLLEFVRKHAEIDTV